MEGGLEDEELVYFLIEAYKGLLGPLILGNLLLYPLGYNLSDPFQGQ